VQWGEPLKPENLQGILRTVVGSDDEAKKVLESTKTDEVKGVLSQNTEQAFKDGAFGLPYFVGEHLC
jgi:2-hydroxychromene-2-carboxylate isomerase